MSDLLSIGSSGVTAYQRALATVSNNIANVNTEGYTRQDVTLISNQPTEVGNSYLGTGARFDMVRRQYDAFVESNLRNSNSDLKSQEPLLSYVNRLIDVMGNESIGLTTAMNLYFQSARDLASDPASVVSRSIFLRDADGLAARFRQLATQFDLLSNETRQSVETDLGQANSITQQLAELNRQLSRNASAADQPSELLDQRDLLLRNLSGLVPVKTRFSENGSVLVSVGDTMDQGILVQGIRSRAISVDTSSTDPTKLQFTIDAYGEPEGLPNITSGKIGGVMTFREQVLAPAVSALDNLAQAMVRETNAVHREGVDSEGLLGGDLFGFSPGAEGTAGAMQLLIQDASRVAAAGQFRVIDDPLNPGTAQARISYVRPVYDGPQGLSGDLALAQIPQIATVNFSMQPTQPYAALGAVSAGMKNLTLTATNLDGQQQIQVLTRDGRHLIGSALSANEQSLLMQDTVGMEPGATYSASQLNATGNDRYLDMDVFLGAKAEVLVEQQYNTETGALIAPRLTSATLTATTGPGADWSLSAQKSNAFTLNGHVLTAATAGTDVLTWLNSQTTSTGVSASLTSGKLTLRLNNGSTTEDIRLGLGSNGNGADLKQLGFDTSLYIEGTAKDDLLVFVTDRKSTPTSVAVTAQFESISGDIQQTLREQPMQVVFTSNNTYEIWDKTTDTLLAERTLDTSTAVPRISYRGLTLEFSTQPKSGDRFTVDGNHDGIGNNEAMLKMVELENEKIMPGGLTMTEAYIERVNQVGNVARQATISKQALTVVYEQAQEARDGISGVSLDEEASALVRFQQAYQANAKVMQVASQLFDSILQLR